MQETITEPSKRLQNQIPFEQFIEQFKSILHQQFHQEEDINQLSISRGLPPTVLNEIMACNPLSVVIPSEYGGRGTKVHELLTLLSAASYESLALSLTLGINSALFLQPVAKYGQEEAKAQVFDRFLKLRNMGGLMITEPDFGSDALNMQTAFTEDEKHYHLKGTKHWAGLTGQADFWLLTARRKTAAGALQRDIDFFICDNTQPEQKIVVEEYFENLGLYQIPYGRNILDVSIPKAQRLVPHTNGVQMMLDLLHRSRLQFPGMALGFIQRMLDEAIAHSRQRQVSGRSLFAYDQVQQRLAQLQANFTIVSAMSLKSTQMAGIENDLTLLGLEANIIKTVTTDLMQESAQSLLTLVGAAAYKLNHIAGRGIVDSRPFQIFEGSNDILYNQIGEAILKQMKISGETNLKPFTGNHSLMSLAAERIQKLTDVTINAPVQQRKTVELGRIISRIVSLNWVLELGAKGFREELISGTIALLSQEIATLMSHYSFEQKSIVLEDYRENSDWIQFAEIH
ncbi:MAG: acyl-CoA dehydrogenase family protein [Bacteroidota bacterium]|nr:acyl-CoA dehydrogenase family protein [Bacteroidota bacterium]